MQKLVAVIGIVLSLYFFFLPSGEAKASQLNLTGRAALLMDAKNGQILYQKNADRQLYPASTTKILTGIIALEECNLNETVTVSRKATLAGGTLLGLQVGEKIKMRSLLYAALLQSANDASVAIAEHIGGSISGFARLMNQKARDIGAKNSHFVNPHGMPHPEHKTTARDLALISRYAMQNEKFREIVSTVRKEIERDVSRDKNPQTRVYNHNKLLTRYEGAIGVKTGYTVAAGHCIASAARKGERELIAVVLHSANQQAMYADTTSLLDYGFEQFESRVLAEKGEEVTRLKIPGGTKSTGVETATRVTYNFPAGSAENVVMKIKTTPGLKAPVKKGETVGKLLFRYRGRQISSVDLLARGDVPVKITRRPWFYPAVILLLLAVAGLWMNRRRKHKRQLFIRRKYR